MLIYAVLRGEGLIDPNRRGSVVGSFIGFGIVTGLATVLGTLLLIVPGIFLAARWWIGDPLIIGEGKTMGEAMSISFERTAGARWAIMGMVTLCAVPFVLGMALSIGYDPTTEILPAPVAALVNCLIFFGSLVGWFASIAIYALTRPAEGNVLEEVFA
jgi:hypothetical protein